MAKQVGWAKKPIYRERSEKSKKSFGPREGMSDRAVPSDFLKFMCLLISLIINLYKIILHIWILLYIG